MNDYSVYIHTNKTNGMRYVGMTSQDPKTRWLNGYGYNKQGHFFNAIKKYGWDGFEHEVVRTGLTKKEAGELEIELIKKYKTTDKRYGYNKSTGGECASRGVPKSEKARKAASKAMKEKWEDPEFRKAKLEWVLTMMQTEEIKRKRVETRGHWHHTEESKRRMSEARKGKPCAPFSAEHIQRIKENHAGGAEKKMVLCADTGEVFGSINEAARAKGINKKGISGCCRKIENYNTAGGYHWRFINEG